MAFFSKKSEKQKYFTTATIITKGTISLGDFIGDDSIHVDGKVEGDIKVNSVLVVGRDGVVNGNIKAQQVICSGEIHGDMISDSVEVLEMGKLNGHIKVNKALIKGSFKGSVICSGLFIAKNALMEANIQAKNVIAGGTFIGTIACQVLKVADTGYIKGKMFANRIINEGGHVEGFIGKLGDLYIGNPQLASYADILNSQKDIVLLSHQEYEVNIEEEIKQAQNPSSAKDIEFVTDVDFDMQDEVNIKLAS